jgi:hypothetical protein
MQLQGVLVEVVDLVMLVQQEIHHQLVHLKVVQEVLGDLDLVLEILEEEEVELLQ